MRRPTRLKFARLTRAFTLAEILLAMAIAALLLTSTLAVLANVMKDHALIEGDLQENKTRTGLEKLFATDTANSSRFRQTAIGLELDSFAALDDKTLNAEHLPCTVIYEVRRDGAESGLVRIQKQTGKADTAELVCRKVEGITAVAAGTSSAGVGNSTPAAGENWRQIGDSITVTVTFSGSAKPMSFNYRIR